MSVGFNPAPVVAGAVGSAHVRIFWTGCAPNRCRVVMLRLLGEQEKRRLRKSLKQVGFLQQSPRAGGGIAAERCARMPFCAPPP
jgi:hypothetical protein